MSLLEVVLLSVALAMDCFAVSVASGILLNGFRLRPMLVTAFLFGFFQALMPLIGWAAGRVFSRFIEDIGHWAAFCILAFLGGRMIYESLKKEEERHPFDPTSLKMTVALAVATSIDALAVGISFAILDIADYAEVMFPVGIIGLASFVFSLAGLALGVKCGRGLARKIKAELLGGVILVLIGAKVLVEHLFPS